MANTGEENHHECVEMKELLQTKCTEIDKKNEELNLLMDEHMVRTTQLAKYMEEFEEKKALLEEAEASFSKDLKRYNKLRTKQEHGRKKFVKKHKECLAELEKSYEENNTIIKRMESMMKDLAYKEKYAQIRQMVFEKKTIPEQDSRIDDIAAKVQNYILLESKIREISALIFFSVCLSSSIPHVC